MEIHQVRYFLAVRDALNFTKAAGQCNVSQPALTRAIQRLEEELGGPLFHRDRSPTSLTELGRQVTPLLEQVWDGVTGAKERAKGIAELEDVPLRLGVMNTIGPRRLIGLFRRFQEYHPGVNLHLHEAGPNNLTERLLEGELEAVMLGIPDDLPEQCSRLHLYDERFLVAFPPGHRFQQLNIVRMADMDQEYYLRRTTSEHIDYLQNCLDEVGAQLRIRYQSPREDWIQGMILAGLGIAFLPEYTPFLQGLPTRLIVEPEVQRHIELVTVAGRRFSPAYKAFLGLATQYNWGE